MDNNTLGLKYYDDMKDSPLSDLLRQFRIKSENQLLAFSNYVYQDFTDTVMSTGACITFYQSGPIDHGTHVPGPVDQ